MNDQYSEECSVLALYGFEPSADKTKGFIELVTSLFERSGLPPDKAAITGPGYSGKWIATKSASSVLAKNKFADVKSLTLTKLLPNAQIPTNDYVNEAELSNKDRYAIITLRSSIIPLASDQFRSFLRTMTDSIKPQYGIGFTRNHRLGPPMYAIGICQGLGPGGYCIPAEMSPEERLEGERISRWVEAMGMQIWKRGLLRDVYPINLLGHGQLKTPVGDLTLGQWIDADQGRGCLTTISDTLVLWEVEKQRLANVSAALRNSGVVFDWKTHVLEPLAAQN
jgi:hypothetical protein